MRRLALLAVAAAAAACSTAASKSAAKAEAQASRSGIYAVLETDRGLVEARLFPDDAPRTVESFTARARGGAYDGTEFGRAVPGFIIQEVGRSSGPVLALEVHPGRSFVKAGRVAMAPLGQFFVTLAPAPWLDGKNTVFGEVTAGLELLSAAASEPRTEKETDGRFIDRPLKPLKLNSVRIEDRK